MYSRDFLNCFSETINKLNINKIDSFIIALSEVQENKGRLFILGIGGSAANASHAVNDFRKIANIEAYAPTDNVSELTARTNDEGWNSVFIDWLKINKLNEKDIVLILSVGGGDSIKNISFGLILATKYANSTGARTLAILGRDGGEIKDIADYVILVPMLYPEYVTPITEAMQSVLLHLLVTHNLLEKNPTKW